MGSLHAPSMPDLKYGLNLTKKSGPPLLSRRPPPKKTIFDASDSESDSNTKSPPQPSAPLKRKARQISQYGDLSARHTSIKHAQAAQDLDPSVYDYDGVYDSLHAKPVKSKDTSAGPKYMTSLLAAAEVRKRDQLRAKEKALQREREEEGEEFADKEKFVTGAYKAQQAEMARIEEEEREREAAEMEKRKKTGGGMTGLYKDLLSREDEKHERAMRATEEAANGGTDPAKEEDGDGEKDETAMAKARGAIVNEDGQIVDKRQLLTAGLNVAKKSKAQDEQSKRQRKEREQYAHRPVNARPDGKRDARERQTRMLEDQLAAAAKKAADDEKAEREALETANKRRVTEKDVSSAKERYLARKRAAEQEKKGVSQ